jgi:hypothetical protein
MGEEKKLLISTEILNSININIGEVQQNLIELKSLLGIKFDILVPSRITDVSTLRWLFDLNQRLKKLKNCEGFERHIAAYNKNQIQSNFFVTLIASYLSDKNLGDIILEPPIVGKDNISDILLINNNNKVYFECKHTESLSNDYSKEHEHMLSILLRYITVPHQISITYNNTITDREIHELGKVIKHNAECVTGDGKIIDNEGIEVQLIKRESYSDKRFRLIWTIISKNIDENCSYPGHVYGINGLTVSLSGPKVDSKKYLREKLKKSKSQSPNNAPYILMIDGNLMLGNLSENVRALSTAFQPSMNTRFSAAVIVNYYSDITSRKLIQNPNFNYVSNPYAKFPLKLNFKTIFT